MSRPSRSAPKKPEPGTFLEEGVATLFEELAFAIQWQRPSLLLAFCESEYLRAEAELALEKRLGEIGQAFVRVPVNEKQFDIPLLLSQRSDRDHSVYSVAGLADGGGKEGANAYRALNMRRELFVDHSIRAVFWLTRNEATELSHYAPDFWVFRHRVVEFDTPSQQQDSAPAEVEAAERDQKAQGQVKGIDEQIAANETLLAGLSKEDEAVSQRLDLLNRLAALYQEKEDYSSTIKLLKQGIALAQRQESADLSAQLWGRLGQVYLAMDNWRSAIRAYRKAIRLTPQDAGRWSDLGRAYLQQGRPEAAGSAFRKATKLNPRDAAPWLGLGKVYRLSGDTRKALKACNKAVQYAPQDADAWNGLVPVAVEADQLQDALDAGHKAVKLAPQSALSWNNLGLVYHIEGRFADAIIAYQQALVLDPRNLITHASLVACYRLSGQADLAKEQTGLARPVMENESEYHRAVFEFACGNTGAAFDLLAVAIQEKQVTVNWLQHDPSLDFIRSEPRFGLLLRPSEPIHQSDTTRPRRLS